MLSRVVALASVVLEMWYEGGRGGLEMTSIGRIMVLGGLKGGEGVKLGKLVHLLASVSVSLRGCEE